MYNIFIPKRLSIHPHLSTDELERRYRAAQSPVARSHWQIVWLLAQGLPSARVAAVTGYTVNWVRTIAQRFNQDGPAGLGDRRHRNPGRVGLLSAAQRAALAAALRQPPADGGGGRGPKRRRGWPPCWVTVYTPSGVGRRYSAWVGLPRCPGRAMRRRILRPRQLLKNSPGGRPGDPPRLPAGDCRTVDN
jgi:hypothetical protein